MAENPFQIFQGRNNSRLVAFLEESKNFAALVMKIIRMVSTMAHEQRVSCDDLTYEVAVPRGHERITGDGGAIIAIKIIKPRGIIG